MTVVLLGRVQTVSSITVVVGIVASIRLRRHWATRAVRGSGVTGVDDETGEVRVKFGRADEGGGGEGKAHLSSPLSPQHDTYITCLKFSLSHIHPTHLPAPPPPLRCASGGASLHCYSIHP